MSGGLNANDFSAIIFVVIVVLIVVRRTYYMLRGAVASPARLIGYSVVVAALFAATVAVSYGVVPVYAFAADAAVLVAAALLALPYVRRHVHFEQRPPSTDWYYRLSPWIPLSYVVLLVVRISLLFAILGPSAFNFAPVTTTLSTPALLTLVGVDLLFALSTGLLVGRNAGVLLALREKVAGSPPVPSAAESPLSSRP
jgi:hypothetical protein